MDAKELRIGNIVNFGIVLEPIIIKGITEQSSTIEMAEPVPLTEEWLLKFGFNKENDGAFTKNNICIFLNKKMTQNIFVKTSENEKEWFRIDLKIQYAHQLQNLYFALTGKELTIK